jgi:hypothetical protein
MQITTLSGSQLLVVRRIHGLIHESPLFPPLQHLLSGVYAPAQLVFGSGFGRD